MIIGQHFDETITSTVAPLLNHGV